MVNYLTALFINRNLLWFKVVDISPSSLVGKDEQQPIFTFSIRYMTKKKKKLEKKERAIEEMETKKKKIYKNYQNGLNWISNWKRVIFIY